MVALHVCHVWWTLAYKPLLYQSSQVYQDCTNSVPTVYQSSKTVKNSQKTAKTAKMIIWVPIVTCSPRLYQQCTNRQKQSKDSQNSKNDNWCTNRHMSTEALPTLYQSSKQSKNSQSTVKTAKNHRWCTNRHMSTKSPPNTQSPRPRPPSTQSPAAGVHPVGMISSHASVYSFTCYDDWSYLLWNIHVEG